MYIPGFQDILKNLNLTPQRFAEENSLRIPKSLFVFLLQLALIDADFNEDGYLAANPDVAAAVRSGEISDSRLHYIGTGYFESRRGGEPAVDGEWYLKTFPDVADALQHQQIASPEAHFAAIGAAELRAPAPAYEADAVQWGLALAKNSSSA